MGGRTAIVISMTCCFANAPILIARQDAGKIVATISTEQAASILKSFKNDDSNLRSSFRELVSVWQNRNVLTSRRNGAISAATSQSATSAARSQYQQEADRLDGEIRKLTDKIDQQQRTYKSNEKALTDRVNAESADALTSLSKSTDKRSISVLRDFLELFLFDTKSEIPEIHAASSFIDNQSWMRASDALSAVAGSMGKEGIRELSAMLDVRRASTRYASVRALGIVGPKVDESDKKIYSTLGNMLTTAIKSTEDRSEKDRRTRIIEDAMRSIRPRK